MTRYTVIWPQQVQDQVTDTWLESTRRESVTSAMADIDRLLSDDPFEMSVELREGLRLMIVPPLRILFSVREGDRIVEVARVASL
jgi:hypothetical protein